MSDFGTTHWSRVLAAGAGSTALCGREPRLDSGVPPVPLPLPGRRFLERLSARAFDSSAELAGAAERLVDGPAAVSRRTRLAHLSLCSLIPALFTTYLGPGVALLMGWGYLHPHEAQLVGLAQAHQILTKSASAEAALEELDAGEVGLEAADAPRLIAALETYMADHRDYFQSPQTEVPGVYRRWITDARRIIATRGDPTLEESRAASEFLEPFLAERSYTSVAPWFFPALPLLIPALAAALVSIAGMTTTILFRGELILHPLRVKTVRSDGRPASWLRAAARGVLGWSPALLVGCLVWFPEWDDLDGWAALAWAIPVLAGHAVLIAPASSPRCATPHEACRSA